MKVLLLFPPSPIVSEPCCAGFNPIKLVPNELLLCATYLGADHEVEILDAKAEDLAFDAAHAKIAESDSHMAVVWSIPSTFREDISLLETAKAAGMRTVLVLNTPILLEQILEEYPCIDYAITLDRPQVLKKLADCLDSSHSPGGITGLLARDAQTNPRRREVLARFSELPIPDYHLVDMSAYAKKSINIYTSRGCPYACKFCFWGKSEWDARTADQILDEVEVLVNEYGYDFIGFMDQHFTLDRNRVLELSKGIIDRGLRFKWLCDSRVDSVDQELLDAMAASGCVRILYGVEHVNRQILENMGKNQEKEDIISAIRMTRNSGIHEALAFIIGYPGETKRSLQELFDFILETKPWTYLVSIVVPKPDTVLYKQAKEQGWLLVDDKPENFDWRPDFQTPIIAVPPLTKEDLIHGQRRLKLVPRLHPTILANTIRDVYSRGGIKKVFQILGGGVRLVFGFS